MRPDGFADATLPMVADQSYFATGMPPKRCSHRGVAPTQRPGGLKCRREWGGPLLCAMILGAHPAGAADDGLERINGRTMGTTFSVAVVTGQAQRTEGALPAAIQQRLDQLEAALSTYRTTSDVSRFNAYAGTDWFPVGPETAAVVDRAQPISRLTTGAFDLTIYPLVCVWGFGPEPAPATPPGAAAITRALRRVDYRKLEVRLSPPALRKRSADLTIDLSGIAKGYACEEVATVIEQHGGTAYLIAIGGEIRVRGGRPGHNAWRVGVERPDPAGTKIARILELTDSALSTSGDYRNFFDQAQRRYSHLLDPRTGRPVPGTLSSVSVVDRDSARADALATALMVMGEEAGFAWAQAHGIPCIFFSQSDSGIRTRTSPAFSARFGVSDPLEMNSTPAAEPKSRH